MSDAARRRIAFKVVERNCREAFGRGKAVALARSGLKPGMTGGRGVGCPAPSCSLQRSNSDGSRRRPRSFYRKLAGHARYVLRSSITILEKLGAAACRAFIIILPNLNFMGWPPSLSVVRGQCLLKIFWGYPTSALSHQMGSPP